VSEDFSWDEIAAAWERHRTLLFEGQRHVSEWIVDHVDPRPGQTFLELAAGPGETGFLVAERIGDDGRLISSDLNPGMVAAARRGAESRGLTNIDFRVIDAQQIDLPDAGVDGVLSRFGLMLVPQRDQAFAEIRRVLRSGGRIAYAVWGPFDSNPWLTQLVGAVLQHGHTMPHDPLGPGGVFSLADPDVNREVLAGAGFSDVEIEQLPGHQRYDSLDHYWRVQTEIAGPLSGIIRSLSDDEQAAIKATLAPMVEPYRADGDGLVLPSLALGITAR
jgi:SAM-dependent methyltransferase